MRARSVRGDPLTNTKGPEGRGRRRSGCSSLSRTGSAIETLLDSKAAGAGSRIDATRQ